MQICGRHVHDKLPELVLSDGMVLQIHSINELGCSGVGLGGRGGLPDQAAGQGRQRCKACGWGEQRQQQPLQHPVDCWLLLPCPPPTHRPTLVPAPLPPRPLPNAPACSSEMLTWRLRSAAATSAALSVPDLSPSNSSKMWPSGSLYCPLGMRWRASSCTHRRGAARAGCRFQRP